MITVDLNLSMAPTAGLSAAPAAGGPLAFERAVADAVPFPSLNNVASLAMPSAAPVERVASQFAIEEADGDRYILREQPLAFSAGSVIDSRAAPLIGGTAVSENDETSLKASFVSPAAVEDGQLRSVQSARVVEATGQISATFSLRSTSFEAATGKAWSWTAPGDTSQAGSEGAVASQIERAGFVLDGLDAAEPTSIGQRSAALVIKRAEEQRSAANAAPVRVDLRQEQTGLLISIGLPALELGATPRLSQRVEEVLAAYDAMSARVTVNGSPLMRVTSKGGAGHGGQRS